MRTLKDWPPPEGALEELEEENVERPLLLKAKSSEKISLSTPSATSKTCYL
jgi:hypothetical protein